jgi:uncharacterized integral membrane protein
MGMHYLIECVSKMESSVLKRFLSWLIMLMVGLIVIVFSISNHSVVTLDFWPLPVFQDTPIYLPVLASGVLGFGFGLSAGASRRKARKASRRASGLENDLTVLKKKINEHDKQHK